MGILDRFRGNSPAASSTSPAATDPEKKPQMLQAGMKERFRPRILWMGILVSMGGFIFGYDTGQISGFLEMPDFLRKFADVRDPDTGALSFSHGRSGTIVALVSKLAL
jgi:SP family sugar:H+ symporter-like MFS transporter